jgi:CRISPR-associated endonuclease/helicase Cas3
MWTKRSSVFPVRGGSPTGECFAFPHHVCLPRARGFTYHLAMTALAKTDRATGQTRSLIGHSLDVAHCVHAMLTRGVGLERLGMAAGIVLTDVHAARLAVLAGLHDMGKATNGFQDRIHGRDRGTGHVAEAIAVVNAQGGLPDAVRSALRADMINDWCDGPQSVLYATFCHHGEPVPAPRISACTSQLTQQWAAISDYDPVSELDALAETLLSIFPRASENAAPFPATTRFQHALAGLIMTADWMGSDARFHPLAGADDRPQSARNLLDATRWSGWHSGARPQAVLGKYEARGAQIAVLSLPVTEQLVVIEAPTGSGKTEASLVWADRLAAAGLVDGMYFAVPTRSAATELHARIAEMMGRVHPSLVGRVVRAVPGLLDTDHPTNVWDEPTIPTWALGSTRRVMGAPIAVGTIDQAMLSQLRTRHSWLRAWCLARQLLVIDEVHASDPYMSEIVTRLVDEHLALGGHALLMSATLGESLRARLEHRSRTGIAAASKRPYPQVSTSTTGMPVDVTVTRTTNLIIESQGDAIRRVIGAMERGEAVLWVRSTVTDALQDYRAFQAAGALTMLHHSRYADIDRQYLDQQVVRILGPSGQRSGIIIVGTQTLEQSLDIDADLLVTDAVPADVLLQRLGRLHRHRSGTTPTAIVLEAGDLNERVTLDGRPLGAPGHGWAWVYNPLAVRETLAWICDRGAVSVPGDVRAMVELATHTDHLEARARMYGERWMALWQRVYGHAIADAQQALSGLIDRGAGYDRALINERVPTRLGDGTVDVEVEGRLPSPFTGVPIDALAIRANWLRDAEPGSTAKVSGVDEAGRTLLDVGGVHLTYGVDGLHRAA